MLSRKERVALCGVAFLSFNTMALAIGFAGEGRELAFYSAKSNAGCKEALGKNEDQDDRH